MERYQRTMIGNGLLVVLVAMLAGFMLIFKLIGGMELWPETGRTDAKAPAAAE